MRTPQVGTSTISLRGSSTTGGAGFLPEPNVVALSPDGDDVVHEGTITDVEGNRLVGEVEQDESF